MDRTETQLKAQRLDELHVWLHEVHDAVPNREIAALLFFIETGKKATTEDYFEEFEAFSRRIPACQAVTS